MRDSDMQTLVTTRTRTMATTVRCWSEPPHMIDMHMAVACAFPPSKEDHQQAHEKAQLILTWGLQDQADVAAMTDQAQLSGLKRYSAES